MKKKVDDRIKEYIDKKTGKKKFMFQLYLGTDPLTGKQKRTTRRNFDTALAADRALSRLESEVSQNGISSVTKTKDKKFQEVYEMWFDNYKKTVKESTWASTELIFKKHILPVFKDNYINQMDVLYCQKVVNNWADKQPKLFKKYKNYVSNVFDYASSIQLMSSNPMKLITVPKGELLVKEEKEIEFYTKEELNAFLQAAKELNEFYYTFFYFLAFTGLRKGEALALTWSDIDFPNKLLNVDKTVTRGNNNRLIVNRPKTKAGKRKILIDDGVIALLKKHRQSNSKVVSFTPNLIFNRDGSLYNPTLTKNWLRSIKRANKDLKVISAHGFRHTHASLMFESGASLKDVQERLGHADIQTTANIYTHVTDSQNKKVLNNFIDFMNKA